MITTFGREKRPEKRKRPNSIKSLGTLVRTALPRSLLSQYSTFLWSVWEWHETALTYNDLVGPAGVEPATLGLEIRCSIRLSYGPKVARDADLRPQYRLATARRPECGEVDPVPDTCRHSE